MSDREGQFEKGTADLVIMNPPFTDNVKKGGKFSPEVRRAMQQREYQTADALKASNPEAGKVIDSNSLGTYFCPLADMMLSPTGTMAFLRPTTACIGESGLEERKFLAKNYQIEIIVTSHDPKNCAFAENSALHESLFVLRKREEGTTEPTIFLNLRKMPTTAAEVSDLLFSIQEWRSQQNSCPAGPESHENSSPSRSAGDISKWGKPTKFFAQQIRSGNWSAAQWYNPDIQEDLQFIENLPTLKPTGSLFEVGPAGQGILGAFDKLEGSGKIPDSATSAFYTTSSKVRNTISGSPDQTVIPKSNKESAAALYVTQRNYLLMAQALDTQSGILTATYSQEKCFGGAWVPVAVKSRNQAKALSVFLNSTLGIIQFLDKRSRKLTWPKYSLAHLKQIRVPNPEETDCSPLLEAFQETRNLELQKLRKIPEDPVRRRLDEAVARMLGVPQSRILEISQKLATEPTVSNQMAPLKI